MRIANPDSRRAHWTVARILTVLVAIAVSLGTLANHPASIALAQHAKPISLETKINAAVSANALESVSGLASVSGVTQPLSGVASFDAAGPIRYMPNANFSGIDRFSLSAISNDGQSVTIQVTVDVIGAPSGVEARGDGYTTMKIPRSASIPLSTTRSVLVVARWVYRWSPSQIMVLRSCPETVRSFSRPMQTGTERQYSRMTRSME